MILPHCRWQSPKGTAGSGQAAVRILADCGMIGDDATQISEVFYRVGVGAIDTDVRTV